MIISAIILLGGAMLACGVALFRAATHAPVGYEDEAGFHENPEPGSQSEFPTP